MHAKALRGNIIDVCDLLWKALKIRQINGYIDG